MDIEHLKRQGYSAWQINMVPRNQQRIGEDLASMYQECWDLSVGEGWMPIVRSTSKEIKEIDVEENIQVTQVKEKFGELRFYTNWSSEEIDTIITKGVVESRSTCEECGSKDTVTQRELNRWITTLCQECFDNKVR